jgi:hypothetical protein
MEKPVVLVYAVVQYLYLSNNDYLIIYQFYFLTIFTVLY